MKKTDRQIKTKCKKRIDILKLYAGRAIPLLTALFLAFPFLFASASASAAEDRSECNHPKVIRVHIAYTATSDTEHFITESKCQECDICYTHNTLSFTYDHKPHDFDAPYYGGSTHVGPYNTHTYTYFKKCRSCGRTVLDHIGPAPCTKNNCIDPYSMTPVIQ